MPRLEPPLRAATPEDADILARLAVRASDGLSYHFWAQSAAPGQDPWEVGRARARRKSDGFSYRNAALYEVEGAPVAMLLGYRLPEVMDPGEAAGAPEVVRPLIELESLVPGYWYVNILAVLPGFEGRGIATRLLVLAEELARETGAPGTSLIVVDGNLRAKGLYEHVGYGERARRPAEPIEGGPAGAEWVLMVKELTA